ncbi:MAG TPA: hypothetical protein VHF89_12445 [Solirubrobacteraceae bacterium]|nr:hypothetical protein [Solirubrobacteraceae bacterium]
MRLLRRLGNPLRSEAAAFRWLLLVGSVVLGVTLVTLLLRAVF